MTKVICRNGALIQMPKGYKSPTHYLQTLQVNLGICQRTPRLARFIPEIQANIRDCRQVLGVR